MTVLMTGFPGFLGSALLPGILKRTGATRSAWCSRSTRASPRSGSSSLSRADPGPAGTGQARSRATSPARASACRTGALAESPRSGTSLPSTTWRSSELSRCASTSTGRATCSTRSSAVRSYERLHYFSTCYVSGRYAGPFAEDDLDVGAPFNNFYEETKHLAEVEVRRRMAAGLPATIYRPSIVVGDSRTGETQKYDGPYFIMQWLLRQPRRAVLPMAGDPTMTRVNVVPRDFVVDAVAHLSGHPNSKGRTYHLADPHPLTVDEMADVLGRGHRPQADHGAAATDASPRARSRTSRGVPADADPAGGSRLLRPSDPLPDRSSPRRPRRQRDRAARLPQLRRRARRVHAGPPGGRLDGDDIATPGASV